MIKSCIKVIKGVPRLYLDGEAVPAMAYTTYFAERSCYGDFLNAGYNIFFVNASFTAAPINSLTGFSPFRVGVFENMDSPDYSEFEFAVRSILRDCPDAVIFPRVYVSMPKWWVDKNPKEVVLTQNGGYREVLFSDVFRRDAEELLVRFISHVKHSDYEGRIGGWQICGGLTQEWFHHDNNGSLCECARAPFAKWVKDNYGTENAVLPKTEDYDSRGESVQKSENARRYSVFCNRETARTVDILASVVKRETSSEQVVGTFYGYSTQSNGNPLFGTHGLGTLLDSQNLDFFSSPNAYSQNREFGIDWADMLPVDSIKLHGKLPFIECDIRTYLTVAVQDARPGEYPDNIYRLDNGKSVWAGPPTAQLSRFALEKCFAHQLTRGSAIWWFDMWGGWYSDPTLMSALEEMRRLYGTDLVQRKNYPASEVAFFADECAYANLFRNSKEINAIEQTRTAMGNVGAPYDTYLCEDAKAVLKNYRAAVFPSPAPSDAGFAAMKLCKEMNIPYLAATPDRCVLTAEEIRSFLKESGVHLYTEEADVVYAGGGYIALHSGTGGAKHLKLPQSYKVTALSGAEPLSVCEGCINFDLAENGTALFSVSRIKGD